MLRRLVLVPLLAFGFGFAVATVKGQGAGVMDGLGNLSAPWLLVAFLPGLGSNSVVRGALAGLAATMLGLAGFYLAVTLGARYGAHDFQAGLEVAFAANRRYFAAGLLSGPLLGAAGAWLGSRGTRRNTLAAGGLLLLGEPIVVVLAGYLPALSQYGAGWHTDPRVYLAEFMVGAVVLAAAWLLPHARRGA